MSAGLVNTTMNTFRLKQIMPMAGGTAFKGFDVNRNMSMLNGDSGGKPTVVIHKGSLTSANNALVTFGCEGENRYLVLVA